MAVVIPFLTMFDDSGLKKAKKGLAGLESPVKGIGKLLGGLGLAVGATEIVRFGLNAAKAASADAKSQKLLSETLKRTTGATKAQRDQSEAFIQTLSNQVGIVDDNLRPALAALARVTGSTTKAQHLLRTALNLSAMTGKPLAAVQGAVQKAYVGNTTALKKMFPELAKVEDKYVSMHGKVKTLADKTKLAAEMLGMLDQESKGMAQSQADPFQRFNVSLDNLKEKVGALVLPEVTKFLDALMAKGGAVDQLGAFIDQMGNPKTDAGKAFQEIKTASEQAGKAIGDLFGAFDPSGKGNGLVGALTVIKVLLQDIAGLVEILSMKPMIKAWMGAGEAFDRMIKMFNYRIGGSQGPNPTDTTIVGNVPYDRISAGVKRITGGDKNLTYGGKPSNITINVNVKGAATAESGKEIAKALAAATRSGVTLRSLGLG